MKNKLFILRGLPASGKSTLVKKSGLESSTVSSDEIRLKLYGITYEDGKPSINRGDGHIVFQEFYNQINSLMENKIPLVVVDATNTRAKDFKPYLDFAKKHNYEIYCVNLKCSLEEALIRNKQREKLRQVPDAVIEKFHNRITSSYIPPEIPEISPEEFLSMIK